MQEENETNIWNDILTKISRTPGNAVPIVAQKSLLGHSKGGSAAWQMAGLLQSVTTGIVPGNRNSEYVFRRSSSALDTNCRLRSNVDSHFQDRRFLMFPSKSIYTDGIRAGVMVCILLLLKYPNQLTILKSSFGFGQVGGTALVLHPRYLLGALEPTYYDQYKERHRIRALQSYKAMSDMMIKNTLVKVKEHPPYLGDMEGKVLLNSMARATLDPKTGEYSFKGKLVTELPADVSNVTTVSNMVAAGGLADPSCESFSGIGVDQGRYKICHGSNIYIFTSHYFRAHLRSALAQRHFRFS